MNKIYTILCFFVLTNLIQSKSISAQCQGDLMYIYNFNDPSGSGSFTGYLCNNIDSVGTIGAYGYYNGDGYRIHLVAGSQVTFSIDSCDGDDVSLTIVDSSNVLVPGAYATPDCPNSLDFTAPYTGTFMVIINLDGVCNLSGNHLLGEAYVQIKQGTTVPSCPGTVVSNDTVCGAIILNLDSSFVGGNSTLAYQTDPLDGYIVTHGYACSPPNNTLWYSFTPDSNIDTLNIWLTSTNSDGFHSWLAVFTTFNTSNPCIENLTYIGCVEGPNPTFQNDTTVLPFYGLISGNIYYFMVDGYNGAAGEFSISLKSATFSTSIDELNYENVFSVHPNPASDFININSSVNTDVYFTLSNALGQELIKNKYVNLSKEEIDVSGFEGGLYFAKFTGHEKTMTIKFLIRH